MLRHRGMRPSWLYRAQKLSRLDAVYKVAGQGLPLKGVSDFRSVFNASLAELLTQADLHPKNFRGFQ
jgi:hypothetical protein